MVITELEVMLENVAKVGEAIPQCGDQQELSSLNAPAHARVSSFRRRQMKKYEDTNWSASSWRRHESTRSWRRRELTSSWRR